MDEVGTVSSILDTYNVHIMFKQSYVVCGWTIGLHKYLHTVHDCISVVLVQAAEFLIKFVMKSRALYDQ